MSDNFEAAKFGDGSASGAGNVTTQVSTHFGTRDTKFATGNVKTEGYEETLSVRWDFNHATDDNLILVNPVIPAGARITKAILINKVAGVIGAGGIVDVGTDGSEATNGFSIDHDSLEYAAGVVTDLTGNLSGTWDAEARLAADTTVNIALITGAATAGEWEAEITYVIGRP